ncbi:MAG: UDP-glucose/GDP-mannose dehydrogenase family protein [Planctomycetes bacterium]|nr:UDP-glucose/GDP-mannose dehydrogenase family protein [Planctomycetota bacterium]MCB9909614.1 UDP-glucose/GDP-mannose dehydrogenase family protein [Planctomycetota bacterium]MCB9911897.1 UDP-glucose/GDP-mannose dehydrogenase family protein [Planctomycetota bacterium]
MRITVIGTGYVGLVAGTCFAESGNTVTCIDIDQEKVRKLRDGIIPIYEPGLEELLRRNVRDGRLQFTTDYTEGLKGAEIAFIAVGTPPGEDGSADVQYVLSAAKSIAQQMKGYMVVVDKSTVPVGTAAKVAETIAANTKHEFDVVSNPEFLKEGTAIDDFLKPNRVVIGSSSERAKRIMDDLYEPFVRTGNPIIHMDVASAELTKYAANAMLATRISFMNEVANICKLVGANVDNVRRGIGSDERIGSRFLFSGVGYGGSCFPKDVKAIVHTAEKHGYDFQILRAVESVNERQKLVLFDFITARFGKDLSGRRFALWGLAFKPNTDDMREAPAIVLADQLLAAGAQVVAHDPEAMDESKAHYLGDRIEYAAGPMAAVEGADALVLVTEWNEFRRPDFEQIKASLKQPVIFDGRNIWSRTKLEGLGFEYQGIGR